MKRILTLILFGWILCISSTCVAEPSNTGNADYEYVVRATTLEVFEEASVESKVIAKLKCGDDPHVIDNNLDIPMYKVQLSDGKVGYICGAGTRVAGDLPSQYTDDTPEQYDEYVETAKEFMRNDAATRKSENGYYIDSFFYSADNINGLKLAAGLLCFVIYVLRRKKYKMSRLAAFCFVAAVALVPRSFWMLYADNSITWIVLLAAGVIMPLWFSIRHQNDMIFNKKLSNAFIGFMSLLLFAASVWGLYYPMLKSMGVTWDWAAYLGAFLLWSFLWNLLYYPMYDRCSKCGEFTDVILVRKTPDGVCVESSHNTNRSRKTREVGPNEVEIVEEDKYTHTIRTYRMIKNSYKCQCCGNTWSYRYKGDLIGTKKRTRTDTETTNIRF